MPRAGHGPQPRRPDGPGGCRHHRAGHPGRAAGDPLRTARARGARPADVVVANAGICTPSAWDAVTPQQFGDILGINVTGVRNTVKVGAPHVVRAGGGSIILISSVAGLKVQPFMVRYTTSKFAVRGMAKAFAAEPAKDDVRVNSVHPTGVATPMGTGDVQAALGGAMAADQRLGAMFLDMLPIEGTRPDDVSDTVVFLASDESQVITAHELVPDAGVTEM